MCKNKKQFFICTGFWGFGVLGFWGGGEAAESVVEQEF